MTAGSYKTFFKGKRITVMGLGLLGRGVGDVAFLASLGAKLTVTDRKTKKELEPSLKKLSKYKNIKYVLGEHRLEDFRSADMILKAAGVPLNSPFIAEAHKHHIPVHISTALFAAFAKEMGAEIVGVTGTRGKSTTTHLIAHILNTAGKRVILGGNVRGLSTLAQLPKVKKGDVAVLELDSWQLQGFDSLTLSPRVSVFTSFLQDHLNYYPTMKEYFADKATIYRHQGRDGVLIAGPTAAALIKKELRRLHGKFIPVTAHDIPRSWKRKLLGTHNDENIACAAAAARALGVSEAMIKKGVATFVPIEGRLQTLRVVRGITVVNDNNGTTPDATIAAIKALPKKGNLILIMGGSDKGISFKPLIIEIKKRKAKLVLLPGTGTERFKREYQGRSLILREGETMEEAVNAAFAIAKKGDTMLLSPACASFGLFKNEYDRNDQFVKAVVSL
jgi:UDP-N-acetylmuramoylalanine--D-glutamate ligase